MLQGLRGHPILGLLQLPIVKIHIVSLILHFCKSLLLTLIYNRSLSQLIKCSRQSRLSDFLLTLCDNDDNNTSLKFEKVCNCLMSNISNMNYWFIAKYFILKLVIFVCKYLCNKFHKILHPVYIKCLRINCDLICKHDRYFFHLVMFTKDKAHQNLLYCWSQLLCGLLSKFKVKKQYLQKVICS